MTPPIKKNLNPRKNRRRKEFSFIHTSFLTFFSEIFRKNLKEGENFGNSKRVRKNFRHI